MPDVISQILDAQNITDPEERKKATKQLKDDFSTYVFNALAKSRGEKVEEKPKPMNREERDAHHNQQRLSKARESLGLESMNIKEWTEQRNEEVRQEREAYLKKMMGELEDDTGA